MIDSFLRAAAYTVHPRIFAWSLLPLLLLAAATSFAGYAFWEISVASTRNALLDWQLSSALLRWLDNIGAQHLRTLLAPLIVVALAIPVIVVATLLLVAWLVLPVVTRMVARKRFTQLQTRVGTPWWQGLLWGLGCSAVALVALLLSMPLWLVPPLVLLLPPLIWGWLTGRVMAFDVLSLHATPGERRELMRRHHGPLLAMGIACGYLSGLPTLLWAASAATLIFAPLLVLVSVWLYTLVFAFAACWFAHYLLAALHALRAGELQPPTVDIVTP